MQNSLTCHKKQRINEKKQIKLIIWWDQKSRSKLYSYVCKWLCCAYVNIKELSVRMIIIRRYPFLSLFLPPNTSLSLPTTPTLPFLLTLLLFLYSTIPLPPSRHSYSLLSPPSLSPTPPLPTLLLFFSSYSSPLAPYTPPIPLLSSLLSPSLPKLLLFLSPPLLSSSLLTCDDRASNVCPLDSNRGMQSMANAVAPCASSCAINSGLAAG